MSADFSPNNSIGPAVILEKASIQHIEQLLLGSEVNTYLSQNDKTANYDGYIELLNKSKICGKITVQVKTHPSKKYGGIKKFDIPTTLLGYAQRIPTEVVILLVVDQIKKLVYWKHISKEFLNDNKSKANQLTITYHFSDNEILSDANKSEVIKRWKQIYQETAKAIKNSKNKIQSIIESYACAFESVNTNFYSLPDSYIERAELKHIYEWIAQNSDNSGFDNVCVLTGDAGTGKSVIIKQLANKLRTCSIPLLAIKADMRKITSEKIIESIQEVVNYISSDKKIRAVLLIDQIDALSQSLSNDRAQINAYYSIINKFSNSTYANLRIIVSCRRFDLNYDPVLNQLKTKKVVELGKLSVTEVKATLKCLADENFIFTLNESTIQLLQTAQYLDTYCRIYKNNGTAANYSSSNKLYEELWKIKILHPTVRKISATILEKVLGEIANKIHQNQTLSVRWTPSGKDRNYINYLSTEGIIALERDTIRFFHQSFYDYVFARKFLSDIDSLYSFVANNHQGLFVRSSIKQTLEFLKEDAPDKYLEQLKLLLSDEQIRYHIKLLILQHLAFQVPQKQEVNLILDIKRQNRELFDEFIKQGVTAGWFDALIGNLEEEIININSAETHSILTGFLASFSTTREETVFSLIDKIKKDNVQKKIALKALWYNRYHTNLSALKWYTKLYKDKNNQEKLIFLEKAISHHPQFVCNELQEILSDAVSYWVKDEMYPVNKQLLFHRIIKPLVKNHPQDIYLLLKTAVTKLITNTSDFSDHYLQSNKAFNGYHYNVDTSYRQLLKYIIVILQNELNNDVDFVTGEINQYLSTRSNTLHRVALKVMNNAPHLFYDTLYNLTRNHKLTEYLLENQEEGYYFKELLKSAYSYFTPVQKQNLLQYILSFTSDLEKVPIKGRRFLKYPLYPFLGRRQRAFIYSLPDEALTIELKHKRDELDRRFKEKYTNEESSDAIPEAYICGGLVSDKTYKTFSLKNWETSFTKLTVSNRPDLHVDLRIHEEKFKECVKDAPAKFHPFILKIINNATISAAYKIAGLHGLVEANYHADNLFYLFKQLYELSDTEQLYGIIEIARLYLKNGSIYSDEVSDILISIIQTEYLSIYDQEQENKVDENDALTPELLNKGINTIQGQAIKAFSENAALKSRRKKAYQILIDLSGTLAVEFKLTILYHIFHQDMYEEQLFDKLIAKCLQPGVSEFIYVCGNMINRYLKCNSERVITYLQSLVNVPRAKKGLGVLCFLGCCYENKACKEILYTKIKSIDIEFIKGALHAAFENFSHPLCNVHALSVINRTAELSHDSVFELFSFHFTKLSPADFPSITQALDKCIHKVNTCKIEGIDDYLEKCCAEYPEECFSYLEIIIKNNTDDNENLACADHLELLFAIYKHLKGDNCIQDKIMDTVDYILKNYPGYDNISEIINKIDLPD